MKYVSINEEKLNKIFCFGDFYKELGIIDYSFKNGGFLHSIEQIRANKKTIEYLHNKFKETVKTSKDKRVKDLRDEYKERAIAWDFVMWAPTTDESIPDMQLGLEEDTSKYDKQD